MNYEAKLNFREMFFYMAGVTGVIPCLGELLRKRSQDENKPSIFKFFYMAGVTGVIPCFGELI